MKISKIKKVSINQYWFMLPNIAKTLLASSFSHMTILCSPPYAHTRSTQIYFPLFYVLTFTLGGDENACERP